MAPTALHTDWGNGSYLALATFVLLMVAGDIYAASFDCGKATSEVEKLICSDPNLSQLDENLSKTYRKVLSSVADPASLKREQAKWLRDVRNLCADSACLEKVYRNHLEVLENILPVTRAGEESGVQSETPPAPLRIIKKISDYRPSDHRMVPYDGRLFFSQNGNKGDNRDILALDIEKLSCEYILRDRPSAQFVAQNDKYLVISETDRFAKPLVVIDRASGKRIRQIKLLHIISWAKIKGNRLIAIQGDRLGGGYPIEAEALIFELPSLKVIKSLKITAGNDVPSWQAKIVALGAKRELVAYDDDFNEAFKIALPAQKNVEEFICPPHALRIHGDKAVIVHNCGEILIYDLPTRRLEHTIPSYANLYTLAIVNGLIFTAPTSEPRQIDSAHVYDLYTGKELAVLPIKASRLFVKGNLLLAVEPKVTRPSAETVNLMDMTLYSVDAAALRSGRWRIDHVLKAAQKAQALWVDSGDLYGAIELCKSAGIEGLVDEPNNPKSILTAVKRYAVWLSKTLDRSRDTVRILEALQRTAPDEEINRALGEARLKTRVLENTEVDSLTAEEQQTNFARILSTVNHLKIAETRNIEFQAFSGLFHFSGNHIYVGRNYPWHCSDCGTAIDVLDRNTFKEIASLPIAPYDEKYQPTIRSITSDENRIYVSVEYAYESQDEETTEPEQGRPDFFVIDKASLKILKKAQIAAPSTLIFENDQLFACDCDCDFTHEQSCMVVDPVTAHPVDAPDKICIVAGEADDNMVVRLPNDRAESCRFVAKTKDYLVAHSSEGMDAPYFFYPRALDGKPISIRLSPHDLLYRPSSISGNSILVFESTRTDRIFKLVSVPSGAIKTLFGLPTSPSRIPAPLLHDQTLFVGLGRDLLIFDMRTNRLQRYIKNFLTAAFTDNGHGVDVNRIGRLMIDRGRLMAFPQYGINCQVVPLSGLVGADR